MNATKVVGDTVSEVTFLKCLFQCKRQRDKYCLHMRKFIKDLKETITQIHTRRRDWLKTSHEQQVSFVKNGKNYVKLLKTQIIILAKELRKMMKKKS